MRALSFASPATVYRPLCQGHGRGPLCTSVSQPPRAAGHLSAYSGSSSNSIRRTGASLARAGASPSPSSDDVPTTTMSSEDAARILGLSSASSSFDDILSRKNRLLADAGSDQGRIEEIDRAYDVLFMQSMKRRLTGEVNTNVRFADVPDRPSSRKGGSQVASSSSAKVSSFRTPKMPGGMDLALASPNQQLATQQTAVFSALALWAILQALAESPEAQMSDTAGIQLTLALLYSVYTLKQNKRMSLGKAVGLSFAGLLLWALVGTAIHGWLRVDIVPLGSFQSPGIFCTEFVILGLLLGCLFLI